MKIAVSEIGGDSTMMNILTGSTDKNRELAPIVLFVYNRLQHTEQTVNALVKNDLAKDSDLFIFSDSPSADSHREGVQAVRRYIHQIQGFRSITIVERSENWGLARNIIDGVTGIIKKYGKVIVLEDDLVTSKYFLTYMNQALNEYEPQKEVMHINGYLYPIDTVELPETYFLRFPLPWGWATWQDRWVYFERNAEKLISEFTPSDIYDFNLEGTNPNFWEQVLLNKEKKMYTWYIFWYAAVFTHKGLCLYPNQTLVKNIGFDGTGIHCGVTVLYDVFLNNKRVGNFNKNMLVNEVAFQRVKNFYQRNNNQPFASRCLNKLTRLINRIFHA